MASQNNIKDTLVDFLGDIRIFFYGGMRSLPLTIGGTMLIMSLFTANYAMLFFLVGYLLLVPFVFTVLNLMISGGNPSGDVCSIRIPYLTKKENVSNQGTSAILSPWLAMVMFFFGYLMTNALQLYNREPIANAFNITKDSTAPVQKVEEGSSNRRVQSIISMICIIVFAIYVLYSRLRPGGCESMFTAILTTLLFGAFGGGWYAALSSIGQDRLSDLFGIANRLLTPAAISNQPIACVQMTS